MTQIHKYPTSFQATDTVVINREKGMVLLGKKPNQPKWRFPGGFVDPSDKNLEEANARECQEECGINLECSRPEYLFSFRVADPRYFDSEDKIMSAVFLRYHLWGEPKAGDDLEQVKWVTKTYLRKNYRKVIMPEHVELVDWLITKNVI